MTNFTNPPGYNKEDADFRERDEESVRKIRMRLDQVRQAAAKEQGKQLHWLKCPKCGSDMKEIEYQHVKIDQCTACGGVFFDAGELGLLMGHRPRAHTFLDDLFGWLPKWSEHSEIFKGTK